MTHIVILYHWREAHISGTQYMEKYFQPSKTTGVDNNYTPKFQGG